MNLYNTLTRSVDQLRTLEPGKVRMYTCGLTVYSQPQIGNWVAYIYADVLTRTLVASDFQVTRIQNITDVGHLVSDGDDGEDKMEKGARQEGLTAWDVAKKYTAIAKDEATQLGLLSPSQLVPATSLIDEQIAFASQLEESGYLYKTSDGMYFDTSKISDYGKLAKLDIAGLEAGARVAMADKKNPTDFAVWKFSEPSSKRDMEWQSPWGVGFPGWHLECSVIARQLLGDQIDLHTGGIDHIPVHHTNEIAQTEAVTGKTFAGHWFHNNHMKINGTKLSKSLGNSYVLADITERGFSLQAFKLLVLSSHYRTEGNFSWEILEASQNRLNNWRAAAALRWQIHDTLQGDSRKASDDDAVSFLATPQALLEALQNDLNTPTALSLIDEAFARLDKVNRQRIYRSSLIELLEAIKQLLGVDVMNDTPDISERHKQIVIERQRAREAKDWTRSDELRDELLKSHIAISDTSSGSVWYYQD